jgi:hypothetical protein
LRVLEDLPAADELRRIPAEKPPAPVTADPGLATSVPQELKLEEVPDTAPAESAETAEAAPAAEPAAAPAEPPSDATPTPEPEK